MKSFRTNKNEHQSAAGEDAIRRGRSLRFVDVLDISLILLIVLYVAYAKLFPFNVIDVTNLTSEGKVPMVTKEVQAGQYAKYDIKTMRHTGDTITMIRNIVNGQTIPLSASLSNRPAGPGAFVVEVLLPPNLNPGKYHFRVCYEAEFALDRKVTECFETEDFNVTLPPGVTPDSDGLTIPQDGGTLQGSQLPAVKNSPGAINLDNNENGSTRTNLVETQETQQAAESGNGNVEADDPQGVVCTLTGLRLDRPLFLPIRIC